VALPLAAIAKPIGTTSVIPAGEGDQSDPSIDGGYVVFASSTAGDWNVVQYDLDALPHQALSVVAAGPGDQDQPDVHEGHVIFRTGGGIVIRSPGASIAPQICPASLPVSQPSIGAEVASWECGAPGSRDVAVARYGSFRAEYLVGRSGPGASQTGDQFAPSSHGSLVAFVDGSDGGSVWLHDSDPAGATTLVCGGRATGVSVGEYGRPVVAVARATGIAAPNIEIWDATGLVTALRVTGEQRNPHVSRDWVAFEDHTTGFSQVVLWRWTTGGPVFIPNPSASNQTLNDVYVLPNREVRVVFADDGDGTGASRDVALYRLTFRPDGTFPDDGDDRWPWDDHEEEPPERPGPASCDDPDPILLGTLELARRPGRPLAGGVELDAHPFPGDATLPVLVCIEGAGVSSAWVSLDSLAVATPSDFHRKPVRLEISTVLEGRTRLGGVMAGRPGASLSVRVLADPGRAPLVCQAEPPRHDRDGDGVDDHGEGSHVAGDDRDDGDRDDDDGDRDDDDDDGDGDGDRDDDDDDGDGDRDDDDRDDDDGDRDELEDVPARGLEWTRRCIVPPHDDWRPRPPPPAPVRSCGAGGGAASLVSLAALLGLRLRRRR
jgi:hypothetical protein